MPKLSREEVEHIAELARLKLTDQEKETYGEQLSSILEYIDKLHKVDTSQVDPKAYVLDVKNVTRDDEIKSVPYLREILLDDMPAREGDLLKVPPVF